MEKIIISTLVSLLTLSVYGQNSKVIKKDTIYLNSNLQSYQKIASDSVKKIYNMQVQSDIKDGISSLYKFEELSLISIPQYKLKKSAFLFYTCNQEIENFIEFNDSIKYQGVSVTHNQKELVYLTIPNLSAEMEKNFNLKKGTIIDRSRYFHEVINNFRVMPIGKNNEKECWQERPSNFFFSVYGLWGIFEVEKTTGKIYVNFLIYERERVPINDFIRSYIGEERIKALAIGYYDDINGTGVLDEKDCKGITPKDNNIFVKFEMIADNTD